MSETLQVACFLEDSAHHNFIVPLMKRVAVREGIGLRCSIETAAGGHPRVIESYQRYQRRRHRAEGGQTRAGLLVVAIDGNCSTFNKARQAVREATDSEYRHRLVVACPDPHVERWYMADQASFEKIVGSSPSIKAAKCQRDYYKHLLAQAIVEAGHPATLGGIEFGRELAEGLDLYQAGKNDASIKAFLDDLRERMRTISRTEA